MKILITEPEYFPRELIKPLEEVGEVVAKRMDHRQLVEEVKDADVLIVRVQTKVDKDVIDSGKKLKMIASATTGLDHIDTKEAERRGIAVYNPLGYATTATAEYAMAMILSLARKLPWGFEHVKKERWERHRFLGTELQGKTLGVIGFGRIGSRVATYAAAFGMNIVFFDPYFDPSKGSQIKARRATSMDEVIEGSDVITVHAFLSKETERMIRAEHFARMRKGAIIINAARGKVVDESALVEALEDGKIAGAALDVFEDEPLPGSHVLVRYAREHENLLLTPHIAGSTKESLELASRMVVQKIQEEFG
jgi:D-3-phosphoglycerate dehydrogenase